ncbi:sporulation control protein [Oceanobacillus iheyensis HTE831]|uniref:Sporulation control protein n=1 Tax=Oceanobacillus iheyensis (strain DSM 14371 / CIP 107618 / JCM 11309 / KCTC 3954 / HTE831) TaxID=221109 RepID=Q8EMA6_OCEIH|nr:sporulation protein [Oceanobacillus iheyensis]BAC14907.1 sporulation control protein [Oceanobacillus iheyensis HTE831]
MFNKMLSSIGIGSTKLDTQLDKEIYMAGETVTGKILVTGGKVEQEIDQIYLSVNTKYIKESDDDKRYHVNLIIDKFKIAESFTIQPGEAKEIPFNFDLSPQTPLTVRDKNVWIDTGLDIKKAVDPGDIDYIQVNPSLIVGAILEAVDSLGFKLVEVESKEVHRSFGKLPFVQEFEYKPRSGEYKGLLDEIELIFIPSEDQVEVLMQIDRKARGLSGLFKEAMDQDESYVRFTVTSSDSSTVQETIQEILNQNIN